MTDKPDDSGPTIIGGSHKDALTTKLTKDGDNVIVSFKCASSDEAEKFCRWLDRQIGYGCIHVHLPQFNSSWDDEKVAAMEERRLTGRRLS